MTRSRNRHPSADLPLTGLSGSAEAGHVGLILQYLRPSPPDEGTNYCAMWFVFWASLRQAGLAQCGKYNNVRECQIAEECVGKASYVRNIARERW